MEEYRRNGQEGKTIFGGVDLHRVSWHVTVRTEDQELFSGTVPRHWEALQHLLDRYRGAAIQVVHEAGYFGFWLHDRLLDYGAHCILTPPSLLPQLKKGKVIRGWLGMTIQDITPELAKSFGLKSSKGVLISGVAAGSPAEKAGLLRGDVILRFHGKEIENAHMLSQLVAATAPNTQVKVDILRNGKATTITLTMGTMPSEGQEIVSPEEKTNWGMAVQELTPLLAKKLGLEPGTTGVVISDIRSGSPAAEAGLRPGDLIKEMDRKAIKSLDEYRQALNRVEKGDNLLLLIKRGSGAFYAVLTPPAKDKE